ncbi:Asp-tRNA(Asn)/Glu-tRNA(Gln) amidotransferase subunit GatB [Proteinivorax tanatarense]|uniref:Aspartyl/glutamyl-tRNA(Asn/Gln) amidotransferase subunit B n=1 Tax=Proteinivorax tanatarense TaxID=1260629 RepID=A0AAU7VP36_9FIRM
MEYFETVIGVEIHAELKTESKVFCSCPTQFGAPPNTQVCPICLGFVGSLPMLNKKALDLALKAALALNCSIEQQSNFDRKSYFSPDLPKGYQITQYYEPLASNGYVELEIGGKKKVIGIRQIHIEEDAAKQVVKQGYRLLDFNRAGIGLIEIVSYPDISDEQEAMEFVKKVKTTLQHLEISDCKLEEGSLRFDVNISIKPHKSGSLGTKTEIKNLNSIKALGKAIDYEKTRQRELMEKRETVKQQTLRWDEANNKCQILRNKESARGYNYFPEPDVLPVQLSKSFIQHAKSKIGRLPEENKEKLMKMGLPKGDASLITSNKEVYDFWNETIVYCDDLNLVTNWIKSEVFRYAKDKSKIREHVTPKRLALLLDLLKLGKISHQGAKKVFRLMWYHDKQPEQIVNELNLNLENDQTKMELTIDQVLAQYPKSIEDFKQGKDRALDFLVGQAIKKSKGKLEPQKVKQLIIKKLDYVTK